ncbi:MAG: DinB family protein [Bacteroidota bacterium]
MNPFTAPEILEAWDQVVKTCTDACTDFSEDAFHQSRNGKWSAAQNLEHLIKSTEPLTQGLGMPLLALKAMGKPNRPVRDYETVVGRYKEKLAAGGVSTSRYEASGAPGTKAELLQKWEQATRNLAAVMRDKWQDEARLDRILLPHPLLGKLMVREMLLFTIYHTQHHTQAILRQKELVD